MSSGKASTICWAVQAAVGCSVTLELEHATALVDEHDHHEEHAQVHGRNREEIDRDQVLDVVGDERARCPPEWLSSEDDD